MRRVERRFLDGIFQFVLPYTVLVLAGFAVKPDRFQALDLSRSCIPMFLGPAAFPESWIDKALK